MSEINTHRLIEIAPHILASCQLSLNWLESHNQNQSEAAQELRYTIDLLTHSGIELDPVLLERPDVEELAELREAIAESELEEAQGIIITQDDIEHMIDEMYLEKRTRQKRKSA